MDVRNSLADFLGPMSQRFNAEAGAKTEYFDCVSADCEKQVVFENEGRHGGRQAGRLLLAKDKLFLHN